MFPLLPAFLQLAKFICWNHFYVAFASPWTRMNDLEKLCRDVIVNHWRALCQKGVSPARPEKLSDINGTQLWRSFWHNLKIRQAGVQVRVRMSYTANFISRSVPRDRVSVPSSANARARVLGHALSIDRSRRRIDRGRREHGNKSAAIRLCRISALETSVPVPAACRDSHPLSISLSLSLEYREYSIARLTRSVPTAHVEPLVQVIWYRASKMISLIDWCT